MARIWDVLTTCLDNYTVDSRGDVGSWIRMAACESLIPVCKHLTGEVKVTIGKLLRLSVEKMDRMRVAAGKTLCAIISQSDNQTVLKEFINGYSSLTC